MHVNFNLYIYSHIYTFILYIYMHTINILILIKKKVKRIIKAWLIFLF
jgi:hypothetical protein